MRKRERIDSFISLSIFFLAGVLLAIYLSACNHEHDYRTDWVGVWESDDMVVRFENDGIVKFKREPVGTYSVDKTTFKLVLNGDLLHGTWEKINEDTLVLYDEPLPPEVRARRLLYRGPSALVLKRTSWFADIPFDASNITVVPETTD